MLVCISGLAGCIPCLSTPYKERGSKLGMHCAIHFATAPLALYSHTRSATITLLRPLNRSAINSRIHSIQEIALVRVRRRSRLAPRSNGWVHSRI